MIKNERPIVFVDALNFFMRHFTVNPAVGENGQHVGGTLGFLRGLGNLFDLLGPSKIFVVWEGGGSLRRRKIFPEYKQNKRPVKLNRFYEGDIPNTVENRNYQVNLTVNLLNRAGINQIYVADCEADDVIGYACKRIFAEKRKVIVSSDKDCYQLLGDRKTIIWSPGQKDFVTPEKILKKFGVTADNYCLCRCFTGDGSDGIPGVKGVGFRSLVKRFPDLGESGSMSVEEIVNLSEERAIKSKLRIYGSIVKDADLARRNWKLMYLDTSNLSFNQIQKIEHSVESESTKMNKMNFMKILLQEGIQDFDVEKFFMSIKAMSR